MKRFFDWMVRGLEAAADRQCARRELETKEVAFEAEKRGLKDAYDRQAQSLQCQIKSLKATVAELEQKLMQKPSVMTPLEVAEKMKNEGIGYSQAEHFEKSMVVTGPLADALNQASEKYNITARQILSGMVALTWPVK